MTKLNTLIAASVFVVSGCSLALSTEKPAGGDINCRWPVNGDQTGRSILKRLGKDVRVASLDDSEGEGFAGLMLYPDNPRLNLELGFESDPIRGKLNILSLREKNSLWTVYGLKLGMTLQEVTKANGGPFDLWGFNEFGRGFVYSIVGDFQPKSLKGGCRVIVSFNKPDGVSLPNRLRNRKRISSDSPDLLKINPVLDEVIITWEQKLPE